MQTFGVGPDVVRAVGLCVEGLIGVGFGAGAGVGFGVGPGVDPGGGPGIGGGVGGRVPGGKRIKLNSSSSKHGKPLGGSAST